jgi:hypothetical protein
VSTVRLEQQRSARGPSWLDTAVGGGAVAPWGFGAEVRVAREARDRRLKEEGIDPAAPNRLYLLKSREREDLAKQFAAASALRHVPGIRKGSSFAGVVERGTKLASGQCVLVVRSRGGQTFMVVQCSHAQQAAHQSGAHIEIVRDANGRTQIVKGPEPTLRGPS